MAQHVLISGGARSGKSRFALHLAQQRGTRRAFIATAQAFDDEMEARINAHRAERASTFTTFEEPVNLALCLRRASEDHDVVVIDCLTLWLSNLLHFHRENEREVSRELERTFETLQKLSTPTIAVVNEVGLGIVPSTPLGRGFRDASGRMQKSWADAADEVYAAAFGIIVRFKPNPVEAVWG
ncbi:MAG: bifunctional adenosylcobinamide kinase/adenosylcobinamide-phosphate guanylyltransferase [Myxococcota bacterium]